MEPVELMGKAAAVAVTAALCGAVLRRGAPELALLLSLAAGVWILLAAWDGLWWSRCSKRSFCRW